MILILEYRLRLLSSSHQNYCDLLKPHICFTKHLLCF
uniref:Uncharacterized protein n=1 Tax=Arundo donax TaxID=35708 RepID=A0A0A9QPZ8_ARUDO